jgi:hypothetical protein
MCAPAQLQICAGLASLNVGLGVGCSVALNLESTREEAEEALRHQRCFPYAESYLRHRVQESLESEWCLKLQSVRKGVMSRSRLGHRISVIPAGT